MNYTQLLLRLAQTTGPVGEGLNWGILAPAAIDAAEQRLYRDLALIETVTRTSFVLTANSRNFTLPIPGAGRYVVVHGINVITPIAAQAPSDTGAFLNPLLPTSVDYIMYTYPSNTAASVLTVPTYFGMVTDQTGVFGPPPGDAFGAEVVGEIRPNTLTPTNPTTLLSLYFPDIFHAAAMVHVCKQGANEQVAQQLGIWEQTYQGLKGGVDIEEGRKRFAGSSWSSRRVEPGAVPQRG